MTTDSKEMGATSPGTDPPSPDSFDLGRRIEYRRIELGMSFEELAKRAGVDPGYLRYFERTPNSRLSAGTLLLLALALDTTPLALEGRTADGTLGHGRAGPHPVLESLTLEQCETQLAAGGVGRVVFTSGRGPVALPVNYEFTDGEIVISTDPVKADALVAGGTVGFEIDRVDDAMSEGWSVVASGAARQVTDPDEKSRLSSLDLEAWAGGERHELIAIKPHLITGRVIVHRIGGDSESQ